ncbi:MAG: NAD(P)-binding domain-containing protein [Rhodospirillales bacterium]
MNSLSSVDTQCVTMWLTRFEAALGAGDSAALVDMFLPESYWRDMLAFTWAITPHEGWADIVDGLCHAQSRVNARNFEIAQDRKAPRRLHRLGRDVIEAIFSFETDAGRCHGVLRLPSDDTGKAWVFSSSLTEIKGHEEPIGDRRPAGSAYSRNFGGANWSDLRAQEQAFEDREPAVLIMGGSQFGVTLAARLRLLGVDTLVVERTPRIGDVWRNRYHSLALHNQVDKNHFPYIPFPPNWPRYISKDMLANFIEFYASAMECNVWTGSELAAGDFDDDAGIWNVTVRRPGGEERVLHPKHLVMANGVSGNKVMPDVPGLGDFEGEVLHTADYHSGDAYKGCRALVLGTGTSGHDCAQDLHFSGADVKMIQRGSTTVIGLDAASQGDAAYLSGDLSTDDADLIAMVPTFTLLKKGLQENTARSAEYDKELLDGLVRRGFKINYGPENCGHQMQLRVRHGGYYLNCGCSDLIVEGKVGVLHWEDADRFVEDGLLMRDGRVEKADLVVTATGFQKQEDLVAQLLGKDIADRVGPIWGLNEQGELRNMFVPTPQRGLWFLGGGLSQNRAYSKYVALQIKAMELGLME